MPRLCGFPQPGCRRLRLSCQPHPLVELCLPLEYYPTTPTRPPQQSGPLMGFYSLQHIQEFEVHSSRVQATRYVPSSGFGCPLDGLLPRIPGRFCFTPAELLGFSLRRFHLPEAITAFSAVKNPHRWLSGYSAAEASDRPDEPRILGPSLPEVPCDRARV